MREKTKKLKKRVKINKSTTGNQSNNNFYNTENFKNKITIEVEKMIKDFQNWESQKNANKIYCQN